MKVLLLSGLFFAIVSGNVDDAPQLTDNEEYLQSQIENLKHAFHKEMGVMKEKIKDYTTRDGRCDKDWIQYSDQKCFKVLETKLTVSESEEKCSSLNSSLITVSSQKEQDFLNDNLIHFHNVSSNVWIGMKYVSGSFNWMDGTELKYTNWDENAIKDGNNKCVQMSFSESDLGKWSDDNCSRKYLVVCEKKQNSKTVSDEEFKKLTILIEKQQSALTAQEAELQKLKASSIPIGFIYTQLPHQSSPDMIWPELKWEDITELYAGLFFRAFGKGSDNFETIQSENCPHIRSFEHTYTYDTERVIPTKIDFETVSQTDMFFAFIYANKIGQEYATIKLATGEIRPRNSAVKIWKRTE